MADRSESRRRGRSRRVLRRIALALGALLAILIVAAIAISQTAAFHSWLREQVVLRANAALNGRIAIGGLEGSLFGSLIVTDLQLAMDDAEVLAVQRLAASYDLLALIMRRRLVLDRVSIDGLRLHLAENEQGWNVARLVTADATAEPEEAGSGSSLAVRLDDLTVSDGSLDVVRADARYTVRALMLRGGATIDEESRSLRLESLSFTMPEHDVQVEQIGGQVVLGPDGRLSAEDVVLKTGASSLQARAQIGAERKEYDVRVDIERLSAAEVHRLAGGTLPATDLSGSLHARGPAREVSLDGTELKSDAGAVDVAGTVDLNAQPYAFDLRLALEHLNAAGLLGPDQPKTNLSGTVAAKGTGITFEEAAAAVTVALDDSSVGETRFAQLSAQGTIEKRQLAVDARAKTHAGDATLAATVNMASEQYDLRLAAEQFDPLPFLNRKGLSARINGTATINGTGFEPKTARANARLAIAPSQVGSIAIRRLDGTLRVADSLLTIERCELDSNVATAEASGSIGVQGVGAKMPAAAAHRELRYAVQVTDLRPLARLADSGPAEGSLTLKGTASGDVGALDVESTLVGTRLAAKGARVDALRVQARAQALGTARAAAELSAHAVDVQAAGRRFAVADVQASWKQKDGTAAAATVDLQIREDEKHSHTLRANAEIAPGENRVLLHTLTLDLGDEAWKTTGSPRIIQRGERLAISGFDLRSDRGLITLEGEGGTSGTQDLTVTVRDLDLAPFVASQHGEVKGRLSMRAHLGGTARDPRLDAEIGIEQPTIDAVRYESMKADLHLGQGGATIDTSVVQSGASQLLLNARLPVRTSLSPWRFEMGDSLSGTLRAAEVDLAFLDPLLEPVSELRGILTAELSLGGSPRQPEVRGPLSITQARAYVVPLGLTYEPVELRLRLDGSSFHLDTLRIASGDGSLIGEGTAQLGDGGVAGSATFRLDGFPLFDNEYGGGRASGWLWVGGSTQAPVIEGSVQTDRLVFRLPEKVPGEARPPDPTITVIGLETAASAPSVAQREAREKKPEPGPKASDRSTMHLDVNIPHNAWLRRSDTDIELRGWITTWKKPDDPLRVAGEINTVRGRYTFQGKKFTVAEGQVTLTGQNFDPLLNVIAVHEAGEYLVRVRLGGTLTKPTIKLESEPSLEQADILSVLLFGKPADKLNQGESQSLRERALGVASGYVASELRQSVANALGVDTLEVEPGAAGLGGTSASVGKYISEDVFVSLSHKFAQQSVEQLSIQYFLTPRWTIETTTDTQGSSGVDLFWKRRY